MCFGMNANKWAPKLVIVLQLATWTIVGLVLLQRGVSSLRAPLPPDSRAVRTQDDLSNTLKFSSEFDERDPRRNRKEEHQDFQETSSVEKWATASTRNPKKGMMRAVRERERVPSSRSSNMIEDKVEDVTGFKGNLGTDGNMPSNDSVGRVEESAPNENDTVSSGRERTGWVDRLDVSGFGREENNEETGTVVVGRNGEIGKPRASGAAAAAAVVMLVIGVVMLVLGPAIVILRALEGRRRARGAKHSRARKDPPPSYEQATLMDEAPRYSTLHLNTVSDTLLLPGLSPSSASPADSPLDK